MSRTYYCMNCDYSSVDLVQNIMLMNLDVMDRNPDEEIIVVGAINDI